jgi:hypothetical protein
VDTDRQQRLGALRKPSAALVRNQSIALAYADLSQRWTMTPAHWHAHQKGDGLGLARTMVSAVVPLDLS